MPTKLKFSKQVIVTRLQNEIVFLEKQHGFTSHNGYAQVEGESEFYNREYGRYTVLLELLSEVLEGSYNFAY